MSKQSKAEESRAVKVTEPKDGQGSQYIPPKWVMKKHGINAHVEMQRIGDSAITADDLEFMQTLLLKPAGFEKAEPLGKEADVESFNGNHNFLRFTFDTEEEAKINADMFGLYFQTQAQGRNLFIAHWLAPTSEREEFLNHYEL